MHSSQHAVSPSIGHDCRGNAKADHIRKRIELHAKFGIRAGEPRNTAIERVELASSARVTGDTRALRLVVGEGAVLQGNVSIGGEVPPTSLVDRPSRKGDLSSGLDLSREERRSSLSS